jgi:diguanylate cyclase (GGDEF)-like protein
VSTLAILAATATLAFLTGRLTAVPTIRKLRKQWTAAVTAAFHDRLTGLPDRTMAEHIFTHRMKGGQRAVVILDLDRFKDINDTHGHQGGDDLLQVVATRLTQATHALGGVAARMGGDEFALILPLDHGDHLHPIVRILQALTPPIDISSGRDGQATVTTRASAGVAIFDGLNGTFKTLVRHADIALYHAKQQPGFHALYHAGMQMPRHRQNRYGPRIRDQHRNPRRPEPGREVTE